MVSFGTVWFVLGYSGQQTSVKYAEATWNYKSGGIVHLPIIGLLFLMLLNFNGLACAADKLITITQIATVKM